MCVIVYVHSQIVPTLPTPTRTPTKASLALLKPANPSQPLATSLNQLGFGFEALVKRINSGEVSIYESTDELKRMNEQMQNIKHMITNIMLQFKESKLENMYDLHLINYKIRSLKNQIDVSPKVPMDKSTKDDAKPIPVIAASSPISIDANRLQVDKGKTSLENKHSAQDASEILLNAPMRDVCIVSANKSSEVHKPFYVASINRCFAISKAKYTVEEANNACYNIFKGCIYQPPNDKQHLSVVNEIRSKGNISTKDIFFVGIKRNAEFTMIGTSNPNIKYPMSLFDDKLLHSFSYVGQIYGVLRFDTSKPTMGFHKNNSSKVKVICEYYPSFYGTPSKPKRDVIANKPLPKPNDTRIPAANSSSLITQPDINKVNGIGDSSSSSNRNSSRGGSVNSVVENITPSFRAMNIYVNSRRDGK